MSLTTLKSELKKIDSAFISDRPTVDEVIRPDKLEEKVEKLRDLDQTIVRLRKCRTAADVFREFSVDAAGAKVEEMMFGKNSQSRQRAQETVLEYALGKPIQRSMSLSLKVSDMPEEELEDEIRSLMGELGFQRSQGTSSRLLIGTQGTEGPLTPENDQTQSGSPRGLCEIPSPDPSDPGGEPSR